MTLDDYIKNHNVMHYYVKYRIKTLGISEYRIKTLDIIKSDDVYIIENDKNSTESAILDEIKREIADKHKMLSIFLKPAEIEIIEYRPKSIPITADIIV